MKRKILSTLLVLCMLVSLLPTMALAASVYNDTDGHWAADAIDRWSGYGVVNGKGEGSFDPDGQMTRAEAAQVFANLLGLNKEGDISAYPDAQGEWYSEAIAKCVAAGILNGKGAGKMDPNGTITREEFLTMYARAICISNGADATEAKGELSQKGYTDTAKVSDWAADSIGTLVEKGFVNGLTATELAPQANINRASVMALLNQSISTYVGKDSTETTVAAKSEGITLIANPAVTTVTGTADVVVVAAGSEKYDKETGEFEHNDIRVESAKMPVARVQGENITVTLALSTTAEDATVTETGVDSIIVIESTAAVKNAAVAAEGAKIIVKDGAKAETVTVAETAKSATVETAKNATVGTVTIAAESATATVAGKVETVKVEETAKNATIDTKSTAKVETVENKAENTAVTGTGSVGAVKSSEDVKVETKNTKVENTSETKEIAVTDNKGAETKVETKTEGAETTKTETTVNKQETGGSSHSHSYSYVASSDTQHLGTCSCGQMTTANHIMASGACSVCGYKEGDVARIGTTYYSTLAAAVTAATTGETVVLLKNVELDTRVDVNKKVTLDLAGFTIKPKDSLATNNFKPLQTEGAASNGYATGVIAVLRGGDLTVEDSSTGKTGSIKANGKTYAAICMTVTGEGENGLAAKLTVNGGTLEGMYYGIVGNGSRHNTDITINGGTIKGTVLNDSVGICNPQFGSLTITGGTIEGAVGVYVKSGKPITVSGGTIIGNGTSAAFSHSDNGINCTGDGFVIENCGYPGGAPVPTVTGGTFKSTNAKAVASYAFGNGNSAITGFISGGTFSSDPQAYLPEYKENAVYTEGNSYIVKHGAYIVTRTGDGNETPYSYTVTRSDADGVAAIGEVYYTSISKAESYANDGDTIVLLKNVTFDPTKAYYQAVWVDQNITLDMNGHVITGNFAYAPIVVQDAQLIITDSSSEGGAKIENHYASGYAGLLLNGGADVDISNVTIDSKASGIFAMGSTPNNATIENNAVVYSSSTSSSEAAVYIRYGEVVMNGGKIESPNQGVCLYPNDTTKTAEFTMNGGTITAKTPIITSGNTNEAQDTINITGGTVNGFIYKPDGGTLNISGGNFTGDTCLYAKSGVTKITGGTFHATGAKMPFNHNNSGASPTGDAIVIESCSYPGGAPVTQIVNNANITSDHGSKVACYVYDDVADLKNPTITIESNVDYDYYKVVKQTDTTENNIKVQSWNIYDENDQLIKTDVQKEDTFYTNSAWNNGNGTSGQKYCSLEALLLGGAGCSIATGEGMKLRCDVVLSGNITSPVSIAKGDNFYLYLCGHTITGGTISFEKDLTIYSDTDNLESLFAGGTTQKTDNGDGTFTYVFTVNK